METEIEAKFLNIDKGNLRKTLSGLGAKLSQSERLMRRKTFDYADNRLDSIGGWVRVRDEGDRVTLSYKQLNDRTLHGTKEITVNVSDFEQTCNLLKAVGFKQKSYQETKRESWSLNGVDVELDEWPWIPPFVELEAKDEKTLKQAAALLGLAWKDAIHGSVETAYQDCYDVTEEEIDSWETITFTPIPEWLEKTRKKFKKN